MGVNLPAFQTLVDAHWRDVARLAHALAGPVDGDDVAQQAWAQALAAYPALRSSPQPARLAADHHAPLRDGRAPVAGPPRRPERGRDRRSPTRGAPAHRPAESGPAPDTGLWGRVAGLPERQREAVVLKYVADLDHPTIASALGTTPAMSRRLVSDGLATLRRDLQ